MIATILTLLSRNYARVWWGVAAGGVRDHCAVRHFETSCRLSGHDAIRTTHYSSGVAKCLLIELPGINPSVIVLGVSVRLAPRITISETRFCRLPARQGR